MDHDDATRSIVTAVTALARAMNPEVTAEGIETPTHLASIQAVDCDRGQGFLFSRPLPASALEAQLVALCVTKPGSGATEAA